jgi:sugar fermentation stimulation protein A
MISKCTNECRKSKYTIELVQDKKIWIGANPLFANKIFVEFLHKFDEFKKYTIQKQEVKILNSRLDFLLVNNKDEKYYLEVKNVPLVEINNNITYGTFPDGYKNSKKMCISDRAYKHIEDLIELKKQGYKTSLVFIVQRSDATYFSPNYKQDKIYSDKLKEAYDNGVKIYAYKFKWIIKDNLANCKFMEKINVIFH